MWKQIHTLTIRENPNTSAICRFTEVLNPVAHPEVVLLVEEDADQACDWMLATWVPASAKKRNMVVPTNSPMVATKST
jgi:hypothetical protein